MGETIRERISGYRMRAKEDADFAKDLCLQQKELYAAITDEDAKTRKNAALLFGILPWEEKQKAEIAEILYESYDKEPVLYVRASYLKALEDLHVELSDEMMSGLKERKRYIQTHSFTEEENKHISEEQRRLLCLTDANQIHTFNGISKKVPLLLTLGKGHEKYLMKELIRNGLNAEDIRKTPFGIRVMSENISPILSSRIYDKIYFIVPIKKDSLFTFEDRRDVILNSLLMQMLSNYLSGEGCIFFRVNVMLQKEDKEEKHKVANAFSKTLEELYPERLTNAPGNYEIEVLFAQRKDETFGMYLWFREFKSDRFLYRTNKTSTSMAPQKASCMTEMCYPYLKKDAYVLDPFCGSATLLIERAKKAPIRKAVGLDTYHDAIVEGTKSVEIAGVDAELLRKNYFEYTDKEVFDEIITEFPDLFQKDKQHRIEFIKSFIKTSLSVSKRGSVWMILTNEKGLMKQQIRGTRSIYLMEEIPFGGYRSLYIIKKK